MTTTTDDPAVEAAARAIRARKCFSQGTDQLCTNRHLCSCWQAASESLIAAERAAWRGIETAPRDGRAFLVYCPAEQRQHTDEAAGMWSVRLLGPLITVCQYHPDAGLEVDKFRRPTHWRPLPSAPPDGGGE